ncbi:MAG TPA: hypothetical protein VGH43_15840 [Jatrophihabitans sp.]|jgi:hypothetical protein
MKEPGDQLRRDRDPDTQPIPTVRTGERQRAAIALGVLAIAALVVVGIMVAVLGSSGGGTPASTPIAHGTGPNVVATGGNPPSHQPSHRSSGKPTKAHSSHPTKQPSSSPRSGPVSCPTSAPCDLPDDVGNVVQALNSYRSAHGMPAVRGTVTQAARTCAVSSGDTCPSGFFWEPVPRNGEQVISKIANSGDGSAFLLDSNLKAVQVGWAYIPSSKSFECAIVTG